MQTHLAERDTRYEPGRGDHGHSWKAAVLRLWGLKIPFTLKKFQGVQKAFLLYLWMLIVTQINMEQLLKYVFVNSFKNNNHKFNTLTQITTFMENNHIFQNEED